jgi:hypothetical protein
MKELRWIVGMAMGLIVVACAAEPADGDARSAEGAPAEGAREQSITMHACVDVEAIDGAVEALRARVDELGGYLARLDGDDDLAEVELHVPPAALPALRAQLDALGEVRSTREAREDVTAAHADLDARIASARAEEARLETMMAERTAALADVLAVEHELSRVHERVEQLEAEARTLRERIAMARVSVVLRRRAAPFADDPIAFVREAGASGVRATYVMGLAAAATVAALAPSGIALALTALLARRGWRWARARLA